MNIAGHQVISATAPSAAPVAVGWEWADTANQLLKLCTSISPYTFVTMGGGTPAAHAASHATGGSDPLSGEANVNAATATKLATPRTINGVNFDGSANIVIPAGTTPFSLAQGRLTLQTGVPVSVTDQLAKTTLYFTPFRGSQIALYDGASTWTVLTFAELSLSLAGLTASTPYDIWAYNNSGVVALEALIWTNITTRATALTTQDGVLVKSGATTRRYLGTIHINASGGQTDDGIELRFVFNYYNRVPRELSRHDATASWGGSGSSSWASTRAQSGNRVQCVVGYQDARLELIAMLQGNAAAGSILGTAIGEDSTSVPLAQGTRGQHYVAGADAVGISTVHRIEKLPAVGYHAYNWLEFSTAANTFYGSGSGGFSVRSGLIGSIEG